MNKRLPALAALVLAGAGIAYLRLASRESDPGTTAPSAPVAERGSIAAPHSPIPSRAPEPEPETEASLPPLEFPSLRQAREEVAADPHVTPPSLIRFAQELARREELARKSPEAAQAFFSELETCLAPRGQDEEVPPQAQTVCLTTAGEILQLYPEKFGDRFARLEQEAPPEVKRLRDALNRLE